MDTISTSNNLVFGGNYTSAGYPINMHLSHIGGKIKKNLDGNVDVDDKDNVDYYVPAGLYYVEIQSKSYNPDIFNFQDHETINDELFDELYGLATYNEVNSKSSKKTTRNNRNKKENERQKQEKEQEKKQSNKRNNKKTKKQR